MARNNKIRIDLHDPNTPEEIADKLIDIIAHSMYKKVSELENKRIKSEVEKAQKIDNEAHNNNEFSNNKERCSA